MIKEFVTAYYQADWDKVFNEYPFDYTDVVRLTIKNITENLPDDFCWADIPNWECIHLIDDGDCQGTLLYLIPTKIYQPSKYYYCKISYGSCSACDTLMGIAETPDEEIKIREYKQLALHIVQQLKEI